MSKIKLTLPDCDLLTDGISVTFKAPCDCTAVTCLQIAGKDYSIVDSAGTSLVGKSYVWVKDAIITVKLDVVNKKAYIQNPSTLAYLVDIQEQLDKKAPSSHNHSASNITSGTLPIARGGTGATNAVDAMANLGGARIEPLNYYGTYSSGGNTSFTLTFSAKPKLVFLGYGEYVAVLVQGASRSGVVYDGISSVNHMLGTSWSGNSVTISVGTGSTSASNAYANLNTAGTSYTAYAVY